MTVGLHDTGEELVVDILFRVDTVTKPSSLNIGLFNDSTDTLTEASDIGDITTEPAGSAYATTTADLDTSDFTNQDNSGDWESVIADQTFDTSDSTQTVDSYYTTASFQSDDTGDSSANEHLFFTGTLSQDYDLQYVDNFTLTGAGVSIT